MLYLLLGADRKKINSFIDKDVPKIDSFSWDTDLVRSSIESNSLFDDEREGLVLDNIGENEEASTLLTTFVDSMVASSKKFFVIESDITEEKLELFESKGALVSDLREKKQTGKREWQANQKFNPFALADAIGQASAKKAWIEYERAHIFGAEPEELHARVWGKVRDMISTQEGTTQELGIHPFVHKKAKADFGNWEEERLANFSEKLVAIYHWSRMGGDELDIAMEKLLLSI